MQTKVKIKLFLNNVLIGTYTPKGLFNIVNGMDNVKSMSFLELNTSKSICFVETVA